MGTRGEAADTTPVTAKGADCFACYVCQRTDSGTDLSKY